MSSVLSLQLGKIAPLGPGGVPSAFIKRQISVAARAEPLGLEGDEQADLSVHGGIDKAIYFYPFEHYPLWAADVPRHDDILSPGAFGENVTTTGLDEKTVSIGDVLSIGTTEMQVTQPRQPCFKLGLRFADNTLGRIMMQTGRTGWYVRVLRAGELRAGNTIRVVRRPNPAWTIDRFNRSVLMHSATTDELKELSRIEGLAPEWRDGILRSVKS